MYRILAALLVILLAVMSLCDDSENDDVFVATNEWQVVKKGQKIPKGLHVRINFETGVTEAKLLDPQEAAKEDRSRAVLPVTVDVNQDEEIPVKVLEKNNLEEALKNIKSDDILDPDEIKKIKDQYRSYDEIKKSLGELNLTPKIDSEVIEDLLMRYKKVEQDEEALKILEDLDFLAHQYDNAIEFVKQNAFNDIIYKNLNSTKTEIKKETLKLMSSLMQNNNKPKIHALETGTIPILLRIISFDADNVVRSRALTALGSLLRQFPVAQKTFINNGGLSVISKFFETDDLKMQLKVATMISDLITEQKFALDDEKLGQYYRDYDLSQSVLEHNWCDNLNRILYTILVTGEDDHDSVEKCLIAMQTIKDKCLSQYKISLLDNLKRHYEKLLENESDMDDSGNFAFFNNLKEICVEVLQDLIKHKAPVKTEL